MVEVETLTDERAQLEPAPAAWLSRSMARDESIEWPIERVEVRDDRRGPKAWAEYLAFRVACATLGALPRVLLDPILGGMGRVLERLDRRHADAARAFIGAALPELDDKQRASLARSAWSHFARVSFRASRIHKLVAGKALGEVYDVLATPAARELIDSGEGCVLASAHVGNWEATGPIFLALGRQPLYGIGKAPRNDPLSRYMQRTRELVGGRMLPRKGAMQGAPKVVRAGGSVLMLLDHRSRGKPVWAPFFGRVAACDRSAGVLLRRLGAPILFVGIYEQDGPRPLRAELHTVLRPEDLAGLNPEAIARRVNAELEALILREPTQYFWLHDRYKDKPPADPRT